MGALLIGLINWLLLVTADMQPGYGLFFIEAFAFNDDIIQYQT